jgi:hypothetical protein
MLASQTQFEIVLNKNEYERLISAKDSYVSAEAFYKLKPDINEIFLKHVTLVDPKCKGKLCNFFNF